jgi:exopolysaccharide biosynthesis polyprenyl glycosylphosphotransferase
MTVGGKPGNHNRIFQIQLLEVLFTAVIFGVAFLLAGKFIYNDFLAFSEVESALYYLVMTGLGCAFLTTVGYYKGRTPSFVPLVGRITYSIFSINFILVAFLYFSNSSSLSPYFFVVQGTFQWLFLIFLKRATDRWKARHYQGQVTLIVGKGKLEKELAGPLLKDATGPVVTANMDKGDVLPYLDQADVVYLCSCLKKKEKDLLLSQAIMKKKLVYIVPEIYEIALHSSEATQVGDVPTFQIEPISMSEGQRLVKRIMDLAVSVISLFITLPLTIPLAIFIKAEDGGPVFYLQERAGLNGKTFRVIKFRSMVVDAETHTGAVFATEKDPRVTKVGGFMRKFRMDEIPQFFNVLTGSMSVVGPRPERPVFIENFTEKIPEYINRVLVKPGITGLAQVMGNYTTTPENKVKFDMMYIKDYSLLLDIKIMFRTVAVVFTKEQSEGFKHVDKKAAQASEVLGNQEFLHQTSPPARRHQLAKATLLVGCAIVVIAGSMFFRYSYMLDSLMYAMLAPETITHTQENDTDHHHGGVIISSAISVDDASEAEPEGEIPAEPEKQEQPPTEETTTETEIEKNITQEPKAEEAPVLSDEEITSSIGEMSATDKISIFAKFISKLSKEDLMRLEEMAQGGFTVTEKDEAKEMMKRYFDEEEVEYIRGQYKEIVGE